MATSSAFNTSNTYVKYTITVTEGTPVVADNSSPATVSVRFYRTNTGYTTYGTGTVYCKINGVTYSAAVTPSQKITNSGIVLFQKTVSIPHESDGSKTLNVSAWISMNTPLSSSEQGFSVPLTTIARASQPSCVTWPHHTQNVGKFGDTISIHMNKKALSFTHTVRYAFGNLSGTCFDEETGELATNYSGHGIHWKIPLSFMDLIPNSLSGSGTIYVDTYNGSTFIGTKSCGFTATVPESVKPSVNASGHLTVITDGGLDYGKPVQGLSRIKVEPVITLAYGSPIKSCTITVDDMTYSGTSITSGVLRNAGENRSVTVTVVDQRNRSNSWSYNEMKVLAYSSPRITDLRVHRVDADGEEDIQGTYARITFSSSATDIKTETTTKNTAKYTIKYKKTSDEEYTSVELTALQDNFNVSSHTYVFEADTTQSYDIDVSVSDNHGSGARSTSVSTAFALMDWHRSGTGIAFGKVSEEENLMDVGLPLRLDNGTNPTSDDFETSTGLLTGTYVNEDGTTTGAAYTFPSDGYLVLRARYDAGRFVNAVLCGATNGSFAITACSGSTINMIGNPTDTIFVRKGMRVKDISTNATDKRTGNDIRFYPLT